LAAYFLANRLLPADFAGRQPWEFRALCLVWGLMLVYPAFRPAKRAWTEELWLAAAAIGLLPLLNLLTTDRHLGITVPAGDWELAGVDLTAIVLALGFALAARIAAGRWIFIREKGKRPAVQGVAP